MNPCPSSRPKVFGLRVLVALGLVILQSVAHAADFTFWYSHTGRIGVAVESLCARFNSSQPTYRVTCVQQGSYEQTLQKLVAAYRADKQPALVEIYEAGTLEMMLSQAVYPVSRLMKDTGIPVDWSEYVRPIRDYYSTTAGEMYSLPFNVSTSVLYTNRKKLRAAGIARPPETWEEYAAAAKRLKEAGEGCPAVTEFNPWTMLDQVAASSGSAIATGNNGYAGLHVRYVFNTGAERIYMDDVERMLRDGLLVDATFTTAGQQALAFADGECAMSVDSTGAWAGIRDAGLVDAEVSMVPVYASTPRHNTFIGGASLWVMKGYSKPVYTGVAAFLEFLRQPANQIEFSKRTGYLPVTRAAEKALQNVPADEKPGVASVVVGVRSMNEPGDVNSRGIRLGSYPEFRRVWTEEVEKALAGRQSIGEALDRAAKRGDMLLQRFEDTYSGVGAS